MSEEKKVVVSTRHHESELRPSSHPRDPDLKIRLGPREGMSVAPIQEAAAGAEVVTDESGEVAVEYHLGPFTISREQHEEIMRADILHRPWGGWSKQIRDEEREAELANIETLKAAAPRMPTVGPLAPRSKAWTLVSSHQVDGFMAFKYRNGRTMVVSSIGNGELPGGGVGPCYFLGVGRVKHGRRSTDSEVEKARLAFGMKDADEVESQDRNIRHLRLPVPAEFTKPVLL